MRYTLIRIRKQQVNRKLEKDMKKTQYAELVKPYQKDLLNNLKEFVAIDSTNYGTMNDENNPFGPGVSCALAFIASLAESDGFKVKNYDNKIVEILCGEEEENVTIMAHADVVPATGKWTGEPFVVRQKGDILYGRGVSDDKGPCLASYYALKALRDNNRIKGYQVRLLVGGNEESGSLCMEHYFKELKAKQPTYGFSPDADWPVVFAEKGIFNFVVEDDFDIPGLISIEGGLASNAVIDLAKIVVNDEKFVNAIKALDKVTSKVEEKDGFYYIEVYGKAAHGSVPQFGINAVLESLVAIASVANNEEFTNLVNKLNTTNGAGFNAVTKSDTMGENSSNLGIFSLKNGHLKAVVNFRFVNGTSYEEMSKIVIENAKPSKVSVSGPSALLYFPKDSPLISTLMSSYQEETGDYKSEPISMGGGTYAKEADNVVAFGMQYQDFDTHMHEPDERVRISDLYGAIAIYANAIEKLGSLIINKRK